MMPRLPLALLSLVTLCHCSDGTGGSSASTGGTGGAGGAGGKAGSGGTFLGGVGGSSGGAGFAGGGSSAGTGGQTGSLFGGASGSGGSAGKGGSGGNSLAGTCYAPEGCEVLPENRCLAKVDNTASTRKTLRMSQLRMKQPAVLSNSFVQFTIIGPAVTSYDPACLPGDANKGGLLNWLLDIDTKAKTLRTGGARAVDSLDDGYCFLNATIEGFKVERSQTTIAYDESTGSFSTLGEIAQLTVPIFQTHAADDVPILLPLRHVSITDGTLSPDGNCIGQYRGEPGELDADCQPESSKSTDDDAYSFVDGATLRATISLEEADQVKVVDLSGSLCVLLTNAGAKDANGYSTCERNSDGTFSKKVLKVADSASTPGGPLDSVSIVADFAASSTAIAQNECP